MAYFRDTFVGKVGGAPLRLVAVVSSAAALDYPQRANAASDGMWRRLPSRRPERIGALKDGDCIDAPALAGQAAIATHPLSQYKRRCMLVNRPC